MRLVEAALDAQVTPEFALTGPGLQETERGRALLRRLTSGDFPLFHASESAFSAASDTESPQGVLGVFEFPGLPRWPASPTLVVALDGVRDPGNVGTIVRSAAAAGADGVCLLPECADPFSGKAVRAAMGAHFRLPLLSIDWAGVHSELALLKIVAARADADAVYDQWDWRQPSIIVIGSEASGVSEAGMRMQDAAVKIPMAAHTESINAAAAAAVLLFEAARVRSREG